MDAFDDRIYLIIPKVNELEVVGFRQTGPNRVDIKEPYILPQLGCELPTGDGTAYFLVDNKRRKYAVIGDPTALGEYSEPLSVTVFNYGMGLKSRGFSPCDQSELIQGDYNPIAPRDNH